MFADCPHVEDAPISMGAGPLPPRTNGKEAPGFREGSVLALHRTELVYEIGPGKEGGRLEGFAGRYRSQEGLEWAEERLKGVGFTKA